jgi:hypothetical protein
LPVSLKFAKPSKPTPNNFVKTKPKTKPKNGKSFEICSLESKTKPKNVKPKPKNVKLFSPSKPFKFLMSAEKA